MTAGRDRPGEAARRRTTRRAARPAIKRYFATCAAAGEPPTITGLALALGCAGRGELLDAARGPEAAAELREAVLRVENAYERQLHSGRTSGAVFALKELGWTEDKGSRAGVPAAPTPREALAAALAAAELDDEEETRH